MYHRLDFKYYKKTEEKKIHSRQKSLNATVHFIQTTCVIIIQLFTVDNCFYLYGNTVMLIIMVWLQLSLFIRLNYIRMFSISIRIHLYNFNPSYDEEYHSKIVTNCTLQE